MDINLNYIKKGKGPAMLLLHGNDENCLYFSPQLDYFSKKHTVYAIDTRGHGKTARGSAPFTLEQFSDDLKNFCDKNRLTGADIIGFSDGGNTALIFAIKYPQLVKRLIVCGANLYPEGMRKGVLISLKLEYYSIYLNSLISKKAGLRREMLELMLKQPNIKAEDLNNIDIPTLVLAGTDDMILRDHTKLIADSIPGAELKFIEGNHFISSIKYEEFNAAVDKFIGKS